MVQKLRGVIIISTFPNEQSVRDIGTRLVSRKLCACVNFAKIRSVYAWKRKIEDQQEFLALFKTTSKAAKKLKTEIARLHPYEVPEIIEVNVKDISEPYLSWLITESSADGVPKYRYDPAK
jgi:periplasmic divalent cation tolerance protein